MKEYTDFREAIIASLGDNGLFSLYKDRSGKLWIAYNGGEEISAF